MTVAEPPDYDDLWTRVYGDIQKLGPVHRHMRRRVSAWLADLAYASYVIEHGMLDASPWRESA